MSAGPRGLMGDLGGRVDAAATLERAMPNKRINPMRRSAPLDWSRTAHGLCATRSAHSV